MNLNEYANQFPNIDYSFKVIDSELVKLISNLNVKSILEVGAGNGALAYKILNQFSHIQEYHCVEPSSIRAEIISNKLSVFDKKIYVYSDYLDSLILNRKFDLIISEQVIEHVDDDYEFIQSLINVGQAGTVYYISTVFKKNFSWYFYKNQMGERVLDPTHVREYNLSTVNAIVEFIRKFAAIQVVSYRPVMYSIWGLVKRVKILNYIGQSIRRIKVRIPGYYNLLFIFKKNDIEF